MLFTPVTIGPLHLRNRSIRAAAFEGMTAGHEVSEELIRYHQAVAAGGAGMTTLAYVAVNRGGLSFSHQLWMRKEAVVSLRRLTDAVHREQAAASVQLGHGGNMTKRSVTGQRPMAPSGGFNLYGPSFPRTITKHEINGLVRDFRQAVMLAQEAGFDAVEIHAGHGYLISQFLSPGTNHRKDEFGVSLDNRIRLLRMVMEAVMEQAGAKTAVLVKMNMRDGFKGGMSIDESLLVARQLEQMGVHALVLSGGFVSRAPMYILRGSMPLKVLARHTGNPAVGLLVRLFGKYMIPAVSFSENYFLPDARLFRKELKLPLVYVGGILSGANAEAALSEGFDAVAIARALIKDPDFIRKIRAEQGVHSTCDTCNYCIAVMYNGPFRCIQNAATS